MNNIIKRVWNQNRMVNIEDLRGMAFQAEDGGHTFEISGINDANEAVSLSGTVAGVFMRPDGTDVALTGTASDGVVSVTLDDACYAVAGRFLLTIFVTADSKTTCVYACVGTVAQTSYGTVAGDTPQDVVDLVNDINDAITALNDAIGEIPADYSALMASIAPTYSSTALYTKGSYAWYDGVLYRAIADISTAESFTAAHWGTVSLADDVASLNSLKITDVLTISGWRQGYIRDTNGTIGSDTKILVSGFVAGDGKSHHVTVDTGWKCGKISKYSAASTNNYVEKAQSAFTGSVDIELESGYFYLFQISKDPAVVITASDVTDSTITNEIIVFTDESLSLNKKAADAKAVGDAINRQYAGDNLLDPTTLTLDKYINNTTGNMSSSESYAVTDYISVSVGNTLILTYAEGLVASLRYVAAYDKNKTLLSAKGADTVNTYTVPEGVAYVRISANKNRITSAYAKIARNHAEGQREYYQPYYKANTEEHVIKNETGISDLYRYPLSKLPSYILNALAYRPLGVLSKGYICLVSDDGDADLATYTIPMIIAKNVPATWAVMSTSTVFSTQTGIDAVVDSVENHGCEIAQHGGTTWDQYDELTLNRFFDTEAAYFETLGLTPYGAVCPAHEINNLIRAVAGGRFGCVRTGYDDGLPRYQNYCNGARSNLFGLTSQSSLDGTLDTQKATLDLVKDNHWLRIIHWHENELDATKKTMLEGIIDYAKSIGLTFVTMKNIPWIV